MCVPCPRDVSIVPLSAVTSLPTTTLTHSAGHTEHPQPHCQPNCQPHCQPHCQPYVLSAASVSPVCLAGGGAQSAPSYLRYQHSAPSWAAPRSGDRGWDGERHSICFVSGPILATHSLSLWLVQPRSTQLCEHNSH